MQSNARVKTDKRAAINIAEQLAANRLRAIYIPNGLEKAQRFLSPGRETIFNRRNTIGNQLKMNFYILALNSG